MSMGNVIHYGAIELIIGVIAFLMLCEARLIQRFHWSVYDWISAWIILFAIGTGLYMVWR